MRRRDFIKAISGARVGWPFSARAQRSALPVIGCLHGAPVATLGIDVPLSLLGRADEVIE